MSWFDTNKRQSFSILALVCYMFIMLVAVALTFWGPQDSKELAMKMLEYGFYAIATLAGTYVTGQSLSDTIGKGKIEAEERKAAVENSYTPPPVG